jgi:hypothetical protein
MKVRIVERTISRPRPSKYGRLLETMSQSLRRDGTDGKLRAVEETAAWSPAKVRRVTRGLRFYYRAHRIPGFRLSLWACAVNGLTFRWGKAR